MPTQLGADSNLAITNGGLADKPLFFGSATAETVATPSVNTSGNPDGGWERNWVYAPKSSASWFGRGGYSEYNTRAGLTAQYGHSGMINANRSHRTILYGY